MKKKLLLLSLSFLMASKLAYADTIHNQVIFTNGSPNLGPMTVTYKILENSNSVDSNLGAANTLMVSEDTTINLINNDSQTVTIIPTNINGHEITTNLDPHATVKKLEACAVTLDAKHLVGKIRFTEVHKGKRSYYINCSTDGGLMA
jgi:hypothetical protein